MAEFGKGSRAVHFHDTVKYGDQLISDVESRIEVLVGRHAVVTLEEASAIQFLAPLRDDVEVQLVEGAVQVAVAHTDQAVRVRTPTATARTYGGLLRASVTPGGQRGTRASSSHVVEPAQRFTRVAEDVAQPERLEVLEGLVRVQTSKPGTASVTVGEGQTLEILQGQIIRSLVSPSRSPSIERLPASATHTVTPARAIQQLAAHEKIEALALQRALGRGTEQSSQTPISMGPADLRNIIIPTSVGFPLVPTPLAQSTPQGPATSSSTPASSPPVSAPPAPSITPPLPSPAGPVPAPPPPAVSPPVVAPPPSRPTTAQPPPLIPLPRFDFDDLLDVITRRRR
jgi:hypothetical protein